jgi:hypothetical protein
MRVRSPGLLLATATIGVALGACGSSKVTSTGSTSGDTVYAQAQHFDSLAQQAASAGYFDRSRLLTYPTAVLAEGVAPATVSVTVDGTVQSYQAVAAEILQTPAGSGSLGVSDSIFVLVAWQGDNVSQLIYLNMSAPDTINDDAALTDTLANENLNTATAAASLATTGGACAFLDLATAAELVQGATCTLATVNASFNLDYVPMVGATDSTFVMTNQALPGVRLVLPVSASGSEVLARLHLLRPVPAVLGR